MFSLGLTGLGLNRRGSAGGPTSLIPGVANSKILAWFEADDLTNGAVSSWVDKTSNAYNFVQAVGGSQPVKSATSFGGNPGVTFDGTADQLTLASQPFPATSVASNIYVVCQATAPNDGAVSGYSSAFSYGGAAYRGVGVDFEYFGAAGNNTVYGNAADITTGRHVLRGNFNVTEVTAYVDTVAGSVTPLTLNTQTARCRIGADSGVAAADFFTGVIRTIIVTTGTLTAGELTALDAYLLTRV